MGSSIAIDFGTTNTVVAEWIEATNTPQTITLPGLSQRLTGTPPSIPSLVYVDDVEAGAFRIGNIVKSLGLEQSPESKERLFSGMKRAVLHPDANRIYPSQTYFDTKRAAEVFLDALCKNIQLSDRKISELVLTVPVESFESYLRWLVQAVKQLNLPSDSLPRIIDEPTAAAFGYGLGNAGSNVLVIDFGGGTLDLSIVRLPDDREASQKGVIVHPNANPAVIARQQGSSISARVLAKTSRLLGGRDIDAVFVDFLLDEHGLERSKVVDDLPALTQWVEDVKIALSSKPVVDINRYLPNCEINIRRKVSVEEFDQRILNSSLVPVQDILKKAITEVLTQAERWNVGDRQLDHILLVGGTCQIPALKQIIIDRFGEDRVVHGNPFEGVAHGALVLAKSHPLEDILHHSYALEVKKSLGGTNTATEYDYISLVAAGTDYPFAQPIFLENFLSPPSDHASSVDFVIVEIQEQAEPGFRRVFNSDGIELSDRAKGNLARSQIIKYLRKKNSLPLNPPGMWNQKDRLDVSYTVDRNRTLLMTVKDRLTGQTLMLNESVARLE
ncbi:MAG: Hsp70 family protein [Anaerolineales bacterium]|nr:MAG: Hsp70 family protein [Anaerolineales bacterium]